MEGFKEAVLRTGGAMTTSGRGHLAMTMGGGDSLDESRCSTPVHTKKMLQSWWQSRTRGLSRTAPRLAVAALLFLSMSVVYFNGAITLTGKHSPPDATPDARYSPAANQERSPRLLQRFNWPERPDLNGCRHVYIDVGSNMGVQIRKLFEPDRYPGAEVHPIFDRFFGADRKDVCAIGFEPHVRHTKWLKKEEAAYRAMGWRVTFLTETAASNEDNVGIPFFSDHNRDNPEAGASLVKWREDFTSKDYEAEMLVRTVDLAAFLMDDVKNRVIPPTDDKDALPPSVVMKLDVEGSEWELVPFLMVRGALCAAVSIIFAEFHTWGPADKDWIAEPRGRHKLIFERFLRSDPTCRTELSFLDDESHSARLVKDHLSLPRPDGTFFGPLTHEEEMEEERLLKESDIKLGLSKQK